MRSGQGNSAITKLLAVTTFIAAYGLIAWFVLGERIAP